MTRKWAIQPAWDGARRLATSLKISPIVAQCLHNRGLDDPQSARVFLQPRLNNLHPPEALAGAAPAAERLVQAAREGQRIVIYGDYDVDGVSGTAILWHVLRLGGADVDFHIPHRLEEGYGLNADALHGLADGGAHVVVTVDCGITAVAEAELARQLGLELIITDHHQAPEPLPDAHIVHPAVEPAYPNPHLCGAGVAFKLAWSLAKRFCDSDRVSEPYRQFLTEAIALVALGTIADVVPLIGENRALAWYGLRGLAACRLPGLPALIESAGLSPEKIDSLDVGFALAPRMNAAGRMGHARLVVELLTRADEARAREIAAYLGEQNRQRQALERDIFRQARQMAVDRKMHTDGFRAIVLARDDWHPGVIGIVASRMVEEFAKPTVLIAVGDQGGQGSGRSVEAFNMYDGLAAAREHVTAFGGHQMAGGLRIEPAKIGAFAEAFTAYANRALTPEDLKHTLRLDAVIRLADLNEPLAESLESFGPYGVGNPRPRFATELLQLVGEPRCVGKSGDHLMFSVSQDGTVRRAIAFRQGHQMRPLLDARCCRLAFEPYINEFRGRRSLQLRVADIRFPGEKE
ncbi:MAG: single-stranded-DNA-specific exonuclease RecJ [Phycisphaerales bacterium]|nr:MAG: single-stranded-DNA-specific exonuclease RecJ [Phycisphaerales bacterium]